jgi:hypothetical protein
MKQFRTLAAIFVLCVALSECVFPHFVFPQFTFDNFNVGTVILYRDGEAKSSSVGKIGSRCWVAWFRMIEKVLLKGDGTADDGVLHYRWTLDRPGPDDPTADRAWFDANCTEPPA